MEYRDRAQRAKIFAPFDALKGFREALRKKERILVPKVMLAEDSIEEIDWKLRHVSVNDIVTIVHYDNGEYVKTTGMVSRISSDEKAIWVVNMKIRAEEIREILLDY